MPSYKPVTAGLRTLELLSIVNSIEVATFAKIKNASKLSSGTVVRLLETLEHAGLIVRSPENNAYLPTAKTLSLSSGYQPKLVFSAAATPILSDLRRKIGWPSDFAVFEIDCMVVVQTSRGRGTLFYNREAGFRSPLLGTSLGIAYLSSVDRQTQIELTKRGARDTALQAFKTRDKREIETALKRATKDGYAIMSDEYSAENYDSLVSAIGVPVTVHKRPFGAMNLSFSKQAADAASVIRDCLPELRAAAAALSAALEAIAEPAMRQAP